MLISQINLQPFRELKPLAVKKPEYKKKYLQEYTFFHN